MTDNIYSESEYGSHNWESDDYKGILHEAGDSPYFKGVDVDDELDKKRAEKYKLERVSSFPPSSVSFYTGAKPLPYYNVALGEECWDTDLEIPGVYCQHAAIGWDYGFSPDPSTAIVAVQDEAGGTWRTYARLTMNRVKLYRQIELINHLRDRCGCEMLSVDSPIAYMEFLSRGINEVKLSKPGAISEDGVTGRKEFLTDLLREYMKNAILNREGETRLSLAYDNEMEVEFQGTTELVIGKHVVYDVGRNNDGVYQDQITDALRYLVDAISEIERRNSVDGEEVNEVEDVTVAEAFELKMSLEEDIADMIKNYEKVTGLEVIDIAINRCDDCGKVESVYVGAML